MSDLLFSLFPVGIFLAVRGLRGDPKGLKENVKTMAASGGGGGSSSSSNPPPSSAPKILLAKPDLVTSSVGKFSRGAGAGGEDDSSVSIRSRIPSIGSLNLISNSSWDFHSDRFLPLWKLPSFAIESEETKASTRHCTVGIEPRISNERIILLDTQVSSCLCEDEH